jgi:transposase, IS5 family
MEGMKQRGFFDEIERLEELSSLGDPLEKLNTVINWKIFLPLLNKALVKEAKGPGGRPPYDYTMMFKVLILQRLYNISDAQTEYQIKDRLSFMRFLGLTLNDAIPDDKTIWYFREQLVKAKVSKDLFNRFSKELEKQNLITRQGSIVDATFVDVPKQRNSKEENDLIKEDKIPEEWEKPENKSMRAQKDVDARWTKKDDETHYGYKAHIKADSSSKLITRYTVTAASVHDSQELENVIDTKDTALFADSAYTGAPIEKLLEKKNIENQICKKGFRNTPLTEEQKKSNRKKSKTRVRVEHVFGFMTNSMNGIFIRSIGMARAEFNIGMMNLTYNMSRYQFLSSQGI